MYTTEELERIITVLSSWSSASTHTKADYTLRKRFVVVDCLDSKKLAYRKDLKLIDESAVIDKTSVDLGSLRVVIGAESIYDILEKIHENCCHGKKRITWESAKAQ